MNEPVSHREHVRYSFHCEDVSDELRVRHFYGHEELSRPYEFFVLLQAADLSSDLHAFLGKHVAVQASRFDEAPVTFPGIVDRIVVDNDQAEQGGTLRIVPALALLELRRNTRIFQDQSALTIVQSVLEDGRPALQRCSAGQTAWVRFELAWKPTSSVWKALRSRTLARSSASDSSCTTGWSR